MRDADPDILARLEKTQKVLSMLMDNGNTIDHRFANINAINENHLIMKEECGCRILSAEAELKSNLCAISAGPMTVGVLNPGNFQYFGVFGIARVADNEAAATNGGIGLCV